MRKLRLLFEVLLIVVTVVLALVFLMRNGAPVELDLILYRTQSIDIGTLVFSTFMLGACIGLLVRIPDALWRALVERVSPKKESEEEPSKASVSTSSALAKTSGPAKG